MNPARKKESKLLNLCSKVTGRFVVFAKGFSIIFKTDVYLLIICVQMGK